MKIHCNLPKALTIDKISSLAVLINLRPNHKNFKIAPKCPFFKLKIEKISAHEILVNE